MKIEQIKEKLNWYKLLFTILTTAWVTCIGWLTANYNYPAKVAILLDGLSICILTVVLSVVYYKVRFYLKKIGE